MCTTPVKRFRGKHDAFVLIVHREMTLTEMGKVLGEDYQRLYYICKRLGIEPKTIEKNLKANVGDQLERTDPDLSKYSIEVLDAIAAHSQNPKYKIDSRPPAQYNQGGSYLTTMLKYANLQI